MSAATSQANLGLATTRELLVELAARGRVVDGLEADLIQAHAEHLLKRLPDALLDYRTTDGIVNTALLLDLPPLPIPEDVLNAPVPPMTGTPMCRCVKCCCKPGEGHKHPLYLAWELRQRERD